MDPYWADGIPRGSAESGRPRGDDPHQRPRLRLRQGAEAGDPEKPNCSNGKATVQPGKVHTENSGDLG